MPEVDFKILNQKSTPAIYADTFALRPSPGFVGRIFIQTDSPFGVFRDTGSVWVQIASNGGGGSSTGINGLNGTTNIGLGGTLANNTTIFQNNQNITFTKTLNEKFEINSFFIFDFIDTSTNRHLIQPNGLGSLNIFSGNSVLAKNFLLQLQPEKLQTFFTGANYGLLLNDTNGKFVLGDYNNDRKYNSFVVDDDNDKFYFTTTYNQLDNLQDLFYASTKASTERVVKLGDFNQYVHNTFLIIDDENYKIYTGGSPGSPIGIDFDYINEVYAFGDSNNALITCDNINKSITLSANNILFNNTPQIFSATISNTATATIPQQFLEISINGVNKKILLFNP